MRKVCVVAAIVIIAAVLGWRHPRPAQSITTSILPLSISGKSWQPYVDMPPGKCAVAGCAKVADSAITAVLQGTLDDYAKDFLPLDPGGKVYLYYDSLTDWRLATNTNGAMTVPLTGRVANDGTFWMMGTYNFGTAGSIFVVGKVSFDKKAADPYQAKSVKGTLYFLSEVINVGLALKFKTGKPLV